MKRKTADRRKKTAKKRKYQRENRSREEGADFTQTGAEERDEMQSGKEDTKAEETTAERMRKTAAERGTTTGRTEKTAGIQNRGSRAERR